MKKIISYLVALGIVILFVHIPVILSLYSEKTALELAVIIIISDFIGQWIRKKIKKKQD